MYILYYLLSIGTILVAMFANFSIAGVVLLSFVALVFLIIGTVTLLKTRLESNTRSDQHIITPEELLQFRQQAEKVDKVVKSEKIIINQEHPKTALSVNVNKIAVIRNSRGAEEPSVNKAAIAAIKAGANGITVHPRPDQRHITPKDVYNLAELCQLHGVEYNIEGNPFAPARGSYPGLMKLIEQTKPTQATLVPDGDGQLTSDHGFNLQTDAEKLIPYIDQLKKWGVRVSIFMDAGTPDLALAKEIGVDRIELYTGPFADAFASGNAEQAIALCSNTASEAASLGIGVNAGHDLNQQNLGAFLANVPNVLEVSIGHALIGDALYDGLDATVKNYLAICRH